jgi:pyridoxal/pyridoxine/pyridoxamine kinase
MAWNAGDNVERYKVSVEKIPMYFTGTGDLFSALFLAKSESVSFAEAVQQTVSIIRVRPTSECEHVYTRVSPLPFAFRLCC